MGDAASEPSLNPQEIAALLRAAAAAIDAEVRSRPARLLSWHPEPGAWCALEVLGHLIETERRGFAGRIRQILKGERPRLVAWDQEGVARERGDCARAPEPLLGEFLSLRRDSVALVEALTRDDLTRGGEHPTVGWLTVDNLLQEWVHHDRNHLAQMQAGVQRFVWPAMGNARRFSAA
jgi:hypothetical protein